MEVKNMSNVWIEEYRPYSLEEIVGQDEIIQQIKSRLPNIPHMIFEGKAGVGKTTTAKAIANTLDADFMELNSSEERGIDTVRGKIMSFCKHLGINKDVPKILFLDEADGITGIAQESLRPVIEKYSHNVRFIFGCNDLSKIILPIQSRCKVYRFRPVDSNSIIKRLRYIAEQENITLAVMDKDYTAIADHSHGDMRKAINDLQMGEKYSETSELFNTL
jgi:replication factor C small subunit